ncbi:hypothetical protein BT69DRAFT_1287898 [Atractiella rhizophila]|nr:hypothetical protein BT69DRAFT_1287898 [Atractiella rhizophila]
MRQKRNKANRKVMQLYTSTFNFREPYQVLVDSDFALLCIEQKMEFDSRFHVLLQGEIKPMITQCCMQALYDAGPSAQPAVELARGWERRKCNHWVKKTSEECILGILGNENKHRYIIATQSTSLRSSLRTIPGLPIIFLNRSILLLEQPSEATVKRKEQMDSSKLHIPAHELDFLRSAAPSVRIPKSALDNVALNDPSPSSSTSVTNNPSASTSVTVTTEGEVKRKGKRKAKGPNPLSLKKKKKPGAPKGAQESGKKGHLRMPMGGGRPADEVGEKRKAQMLDGAGAGEPDGGRPKKRKRMETSQPSIEA